MKNCLVCGKELVRKSQTACCSQLCDSIFRRRESIRKWLAGELQGYKNSYNLNVKSFVRSYLHERSNSHCDKCGFAGINPISEKSVLQIHHKDGNATHVTPDNLELLCPNCHSMTETFMGNNRGNSSRKNRYSED
jgi:5-methylcytosine-specific restriction endonuclease McrA